MQWKVSSVSDVMVQLNLYKTERKMKTPQVVALHGMTPLGFKDTRPQFSRERHGSLYDRGSADSWYSRDPDPHWYPNASYVGIKITDLTAEEVSEYMQGYEDNEKSGGKKDYT
jgi:hypothetical protein